MTGPAESDYSEELIRFLDICKVPRCSDNNSAIVKYIVGFASENGLDFGTDEWENIYIDHPGKASGIILQCHTDMVPVTAKGVDHDWKKDPIKTYIENGRIHADGTSLGADNGAGIAICLCALKAPELEGIGFRCLFTSNEEIGIIGADKISAEWLKGYRYLINLDNESTEYIVIGCAGGKIGTANFVPTCEPICGDVYRLNVGGLMGGHSGLFIGEHANAMLLAIGYLKKLKEPKIVEIASGDAFNVIPSSAEVVFAVPEGTDVHSPLSSSLADARKKFAGNEPNIEMELSGCDGGDYGIQWNAESTTSFLNMVENCPKGPLENSKRGMVSSLNFGKFYGDRAKFCIEFLVRSIRTNDLTKYFNKIRSIFGNIGGTVTDDADFKCWSEKSDSKLVATAVDAYAEVFGKKATAKAVHMGVETGAILSINPDMAAISIGPDISFPHSVMETMDIASLSMVKTLTYRIVRKLSMPMDKYTVQD